MTLEIKATIPQSAVEIGEAAVYLARAMEAIGFARVSVPDAGLLLRDAKARAAGQDLDGSPRRETYAADAPADVVPAAVEEPKRQRGQPSPGRARRTKAEIAEDEAAAAAEGSPAQISTGDERVGPDDDAETRAQDEADEQAETATEKAAPDRPKTHDDVRAELGEYVKAFGMPAAQEDGPKLLELAFPGKTIGKISDIPDTQKDLQCAIDGFREMRTKNPFKREAV